MTSNEMRNTGHAPLHQLRQNSILKVTLNEPMTPKDQKL